MSAKARSSSRASPASMLWEIESAPASGTSRKALRRLSKVPPRSTAAFALVPSEACDVTRPVA